MNKKTILNASAAFFAITSLASAATSTLQIRTNSGLFAEFSDGTATTGTSVFFGAYTGAPLTSSTSLSSFLSDFSTFDSSISLMNAGSVALGGPVEGYFGDSGVQFVIDENDFALGTQVFALFVNVSDFASAGSASEYAIVTNAGWQLVDDNGQGDLSLVDLNTFGAGAITSSDIEVGSSDSLTITNPPSVLGGTFDSIQLSAVPEPSSTALLGLAGVSMLLRRKRS